ncbi:MAG: thioredoxin domain-containing protein [Candidatus Pacebacteria bacterium]|nr:thioredoxin domain-containing protein [Candidatus Paceibacterota bacterium]
METNTNKIILPISIIIAGLLIAGAVYMSGRPSANLATNTGNTAGQSTAGQDITMAPVTSADHILGNINAKIVLVEYSDLECPFCKQFHTTLHQISDAYGKNNDVAWVYRHMPIDSLHPKSRKESEAAECAGEIGGDQMFWNYIDKIYAITPSNNQLDPAQLPMIADQLGLDKAKFATCLASGKYAAKVEAQRADGVAAGGQGTPYTIILTGDRKIPINQGAIPYDALKSVIDQLLAGK